MLEDKKQEQIAGIISDYFDGTVAEADIDILAMKVYENAFNDTKWQKLKEWVEEEIKKYEPTYDEWMALDYDFYRKTNLQIRYKIVLDKMRELEAEDE